MSTRSRGSTTIFHDEVRLTLEAQLQQGRELRRTALRMVQTNLVIGALIAVAFAVAAGTNIVLDPYANVFTAAGAVAFVGSIVVAAVAYASTTVRGGLDARTIDVAHQAGYTDDEFADALATSYGRWIDANADAVAAGDFLVTAAALLIVDAIVFLVGGVAVVALALSAGVSMASFLGLIVALYWFNRRVYRMESAGVTSGAAPFPAVRQSTGRSRRDGLDALRRSLRGAGEAPMRGTGAGTRSADHPGGSRSAGQEPGPPSPDPQGDSPSPGRQDGSPAPDRRNR